MKQTDTVFYTNELKKYNVRIQQIKESLSDASLVMLLDKKVVKELQLQQKALLLNLKRVLKYTGYWDYELQELCAKLQQVIAQLETLIQSARITKAKMATNVNTK